MLLLSLRALSVAPQGPGSIWTDLEALLNSTGVSGRLCVAPGPIHILLMYES